MTRFLKITALLIIMANSFNFSQSNEVNVNEEPQASIEFTAENGSETRTFLLGQDPNATDGIDGQFGEQELPPPPPSGTSRRFRRRCSRTSRTTFRPRTRTNSRVSSTRRRCGWRERSGFPLSSSGH